MAAKLKIENLIGAELGKFEQKLGEFQKYLASNSILNIDSESFIDMEGDEQEKLHKEIIVQIKMQDAVLNWLPLVKTLKESEEKNIQVRGGAEINGLFKKRRTVTENNNE